MGAITIYTCDICREEITNPRQESLKFEGHIHWEREDRAKEKARMREKRRQLWHQKYGTNDIMPDYDYEDYEYRGDLLIIPAVTCCCEKCSRHIIGAARAAAEAAMEECRPCECCGGK